MKTSKQINQLFDIDKYPQILEMDLRNREFSIKLFDKYMIVILFQILHKKEYSF